MNEPVKAFPDEPFPTIPNEVIDDAGYDKITFRYLLQPIGHFQFISPAITALTGYSPNEFYKTPQLWLQCLHPEDQPAQSEILRGKDECRGRRFRILKPGYGYVWLEQDVSVNFDDSGQPLAVISECLIQDEAHVSHMRGDLSDPANLHLLDFSPTPLSINDITTLKFLFASTSLFNYLKYPMDELLTMKLDDLAVWINPGDRENFNKTLRSKTNAEATLINLRAVDGSIKRAQVGIQIVPFRGKPAFMAHISDVTSIVDTVARLQIEKDALTRLVEHSPLAIMMVDSGGKTILWNRKTEEVFGWKSAEVLGKTLPFIVDYGDSSFNDYLANLMGQNSWTGTDVRLRKKDGSDIMLCMHTSPVYDVDGKLEGAMGILANSEETGRAQMLQRALYAISEATCEFQNLNDLFKSIHQALYALMPAENLYIALCDQDPELISYPYFVDSEEPPPQPARGERGVTAYVIRTGEPLLANPAKFKELFDKGEIEEVGVPSIDWLGVPLKIKGRAFGVIAVQTYTEGIRYTEEHMKLLEFVSDQIALAVERTRNEEAIHTSEKRYRDIVEDQTDLICRFKLDGSLTFANKAYGDFFSLVGDSIRNSSIQTVFPKARFNRITRNKARLAGRGKAESFESEHLLPDGSQHWLEWKIRPIQSEPGNLIEVQAVGRDITDQQLRRREQELITRITSATRFTHSADDMLNEILDQINQFIQLNALGFSLYKAKEETMTLDYVRGSWKDYAHQPIPVEPATIREILGTRGLYLNNRFVPDAADPQNGMTRDLTGLAGIPMVAENTPIGMLWFGKRTPISDEEVRLIQAVGEITANGLHRITLFEKTQHRLRRLTTLKTIDLAISSTVELKVILDILIDQIVSQLSVDAASIWLYDPATQLLEYSAGSGFHSSHFKNYRLRMGESHAGTVALERKREIVQNLDTINDSMTEFYRKLGEQFTSFIAIPLIAKGQVKGVLEIFTKRRLDPDSEWLEFLESLGGQAAIALDNASLFERLQRSNIELGMAYDATIDGWARALEMRDQETIGHTRRVADLTIGLVRILRDEKLDLEQIRRGVMLHDIGKMGIPDRILLKRGRLTQDEWKIMRMHPTYAYDMLHSVPNLRKLVDIPYCHHERWDGSGYPRGLREEEIPLSARIFAIVDVWDAIRSDRPYRPAWPEQRAIDYIKAESGKQFDPRLDLLFLENLSVLIKPEAGYLKA